MAKTDAELRQASEDWRGAIMALSVLAAGGLLAYQGYCWLRYGEWPPYAGSDVFLWFGADANDLTWVGLRKVMVWLVGLPLAIWIFATGCLISFAIYYSVEEHIDDRKFNAGR